MHILSVNLVNKEGLRLTVSKTVNVQRSVGTENELCQLVKVEINSHKMHFVYGPWEVVSSKWEC